LTYAYFLCYIFLISKKGGWQMSTEKGSIKIPCINCGGEIEIEGEIKKSTLGWPQRLVCKIGKNEWGVCKKCNLKVHIYFVLFSAGKCEIAFNFLPEG